MRKCQSKPLLNGSQLYMRPTRVQPQCAVDFRKLAVFLDVCVGGVIAQKTVDGFISDLAKLFVGMNPNKHFAFSFKKARSPTIRSHGNIVIMVFQYFRVA